MTQFEPHPVIWLLRRDRFVQLQLAWVAVLAWVIAGPGASWAPGWLTANTASATLVVIPFVGCLWGLRAISDEEERLAWTGVAVSLGCMCLTLAASHIIPSASWPRSLQSGRDALYLLFYVPFLVALERKPHVPQGSRASHRERWIRALGVTTFALIWMVYLVLAPATIGRTEAHPYAPTGLVLVLLDAVVLGRLVTLRHRTARVRWQTIYAALAATWAILLGTDALDLAVSLGWPVFRSGGPTDLRWAVQWTAFLLAVRLRHYPFPAEVPTPATDRRAVSPSPVRAGGYLVLGAFSLPFVHLVAIVIGAFPSGDRTLLTVMSSVAIANILVLLALAIVAYRLIEEQRASMAQEQRALETRLQHGQRMEAIGRLAGGVAHDFNNLLTVITGFTDLVQEAVGKHHAVSGEVEEIGKAAARAAGLTRQLLAFSRRQTLKTERLDLNQVVGNAVKMLGRLIGEHIELQTDMAAHLHPVLADAGQLDLVLINLVANARDAMPNGGRLTLATTNITVDEQGARRRQDHQRAGHYVQLTVRDTGTGIPADSLPYIFEPFFTTKESGRGTGLGLAMVHGIVIQSGGSIDVESQVGAGTCLTVRLPAAEGGVPAPPPAAPIHADGGTQTILVAEDDEAVRGLVRTILERLGYRVIVASSGEDALEQAAACATPIDLLLTDVVMPGINGPALARRLTTLRPEMKVVFMTGYADDAAVKDVAHRGAESLILKPFPPSLLATRVRAALDQ